MLIINQDILKTLILQGVYDSIYDEQMRNNIWPPHNCEPTCGLQARPNLNKGAPLCHVLAIPSAGVVEHRHGLAILSSSWWHHRPGFKYIDSNSKTEKTCFSASESKRVEVHVYQRYLDT